MTLIDLTVLNLQLNHIIDSDLHHGISLEDARYHIMTGDVFEWLKDKFQDEIDLGIYERQPSKNEIVRQWQRTLARYEGDEKTALGGQSQWHLSFSCLDKRDRAAADRL